MLEEQLEKEIVKSIQIGLSIAKIEKVENGGRIDNAERQRKIDRIINALCSTLQQNESFETHIFSRFGYDILLGYNREKHQLISFMSMNRINSLLTSKQIKDKKNYVFGLMRFNKANRKQQFLFEDVVEVVSDENKKVERRIRSIIEEDGDIEYITVLYNIRNYTLINVKEIKLSQYEEQLGEKDLSDYISVNYEDINENNNIDKEEILGDLEFTIKDEILTRANEFNIEKKQDKEEIDNE